MYNNQVVSVVRPQIHKFTNSTVLVKSALDEVAAKQESRAGLAPHKHQRIVTKKRILPVCCLTVDTSAKPETGKVIPGSGGLRKV